MAFVSWARPTNPMQDFIATVNCARFSEDEPKDALLEAAGGIPGHIQSYHKVLQNKGEMGENDRGMLQRNVYWPQRGEVFCHGGISIDVCGDLFVVVHVFIPVCAAHIVTVIFPSSTNDGVVVRCKRGTF